MQLAPDSRAGAARFLLARPPVLMLATLQSRARRSYWRTAPSGRFGGPSRLADL